MASIDCKVSIEKTVHDAIRETFQMIMDKHGLRIDSVDVTWLDTSTTAQKCALVRSIKMTTVTR